MAEEVRPLYQSRAIPPGVDWTHPSPAQITKSLNQAHDNIRALEKEKDNLRALLTTSEITISRLGTKLWVLGIVVAGEGALLLKLLFG